MLGRETSAKVDRAERAAAWVHQRSPYALVAGLLGIFAPIDGLLFFPLSLAAIVVGVMGWMHLGRHPELRGRVLCLIGIIGGVIGMSLFVALRLWDGPNDGEPPAPTNESAQVVPAPEVDEVLALTALMESEVIG